jgi:tetratricopeptide (TPR) repeat protein
MRKLISGVVIVCGVYASGACGRKEAEAPAASVVTREAAPEKKDTKVDPEYAGKLEATRRLIRQGEATAAISAAESLIELQRNNPESWVALASAQLLANDAQAALKSASMAVEVGKDDALAWGALGAAQRALGQHEEARRSLQKALELDPGSRIARFNLAGVAADLGELERARKELQSLVEADEGDVETRFLLARVLLDQKERGPAKEQLVRLVQIEPRHFGAQRMLAAMAWDEGNYRRAFERAKIAARINADDAQNSYFLESSFYVLVAARLTCEVGARPWAGDAIVKVLNAFEQEEELEGAGSFVALDDKLGADPNVQARVAKAAVCKPAGAVAPEHAPPADGPKPGETSPSGPKGPSPE